MPVPMLDLRAQYAAIKEEINEAVLAVLASQQFRGGPPVDAFEAAVARYIGARHALGVATGTDALLLILRGLDLQPGDEVITTPFSFFATAGAIVNAGGAPVFVDIEPDTFNINPALIEAKITDRTRAILPVHIFGQCANMDALLDLGARYDLPIIEDAAQALGARYRDQMACSMGAAAAISFYPTKNLGAAGEGGMVVTQRPELGEKVRLLRSHGANRSYHHDLVGTNSHLHALQAAVLNVKLRYLDAWNDRRRLVAARYDALLKKHEAVRCPVVRPECHHVYHQYVIRIPQRDQALALLQEREIGCGVFYPLPLHRQACFAGLGCAESHCPEADKAAQEVLALPIYPEISEAQQEEVAAALSDHLARC